MATASEKRTLRSKFEKYEGKISHMYLDSKGYVTVGIGHLLSSLADAQKLVFKNSNNKPANKIEIRTDYETVKKQPPNRLASSYKKYTKLTLPDAEIDKLTNKHIESFEKELARVYSDFNTYPSDVRLALFDMIFNLGMTRLRSRFPKFNKAIKAKDWQKAAKESYRPDVGVPRNQYVRKLLEVAMRKHK